MMNVHKLPVRIMSWVGPEKCSDYLLPFKRIAQDENVTKYCVCSKENENTHLPFQGFTRHNRPKYVCQKVHTHCFHMNYEYKSQPAAANQMHLIN